MLKGGQWEGKAILDSLSLPGPETANSLPLDAFPGKHWVSGHK